MFTITAVQAQKNRTFFSHVAKSTARGVRFLLRFNVYLFLVPSDQLFFLYLPFILRNSWRCAGRTWYLVHPGRKIGGKCIVKLRTGGGFLRANAMGVAYYELVSIVLDQVPVEVISRWGGLGK